MEDEFLSYVAFVTINKLIVVYYYHLGSIRTACFYRVTFLRPSNLQGSPPHPVAMSPQVPLASAVLQIVLVFIELDSF